MKRKTKTINATKTMYYADAPYGQVFWDQDNKPINAIHENDSRFREEYMYNLLEHFNIKVERKEKIPASVKDATKHWGVWED